MKFALPSLKYLSWESKMVPFIDDFVFPTHGWVHFKWRVCFYKILESLSILITDVLLVFMFIWNKPSLEFSKKMVFAYKIYLKFPMA